MKLEKELKKSLDLSLWNRALALFLAFIMPFAAYAEPVIGDVPMPPASFTRVTDSGLLDKLGLNPVGGAWCYEDDANAILISAPARERARCELSLMYELKRQEVKNDFKVKSLNLRIESLTKQHSEILAIKDREIENLTATALERPNNYWYLYAGGGFIVGVASAIAIVYIVK